MLKSNGNYKNCITFAARKKNGTLTEWLGGGLQNRIRQFESARYLNGKTAIDNQSFVVFL